MSDFSKEDTDISESELEEYAESCYAQLKESSHIFRVSDDKYKCPYCSLEGKQIFRSGDLLQHAAGVSQGSGRRKVKDRGRHLGLKRYMQELNGGKRSSPEGEMDDRARHDSCYMNELYVWPWMGIVANIPIQRKDSLYVGESDSKLWDLLTREGINLTRVRPLWNFKGHSGYAILEFKREWHGIFDALRFEKAYEEKHQGKEDYHGAKEKGEKLYGWVARAVDYHSDSVVGDYLQRKGDLKTIAQCQKEEHNKESKLLSQLANTIDVQNMRLTEMENKYKETSMSISSLIDQKHEIIRDFNEERRKQQKRDSDQIKQIFLEQDKIILELLAQRKKLEEEEQELKKREAQNEHENLRLYYEKKQENEKATLELKRADEKMLMLVEEHKKEKEQLQRKAIDLEKKLDAKQALELKIRQLKRRLHVVKHTGDDGGKEILAKLQAILEELEEKEQEYEDLDKLSQALLIMERKSNDELQEARKEIINVLNEQSSRATIGVKRMGELNSNAFLPAAKRLNSGKDTELKAAELCTQWESRTKDSNWHPFKVIPIPIEGGKSHKTILDEEDEELRKLKNEFGKEAYEAVSTALMEMNKYDPSGRHVVDELWNRKENRRASNQAMEGAQKQEKLETSSSLLVRCPTFCRFWK